MNIVQITPGAGGMYCGGCFRDNALVAALRRAGHETLMVPLYLPLTLDEPDQSALTPIFFSGINVYLEQKSALFRRLPGWLRQPLASRKILAWAGHRAGKTRAEEVGDITISMLRGEEGHQAQELDQLIGWLKNNGRPDVICLSNALLVGFARRMKRELNCRVVCLLSGEDTFVDGLPPNVREAAWKILVERCREIDLFFAPSRYFADLMTARLDLRPEQKAILHNGIQLTGYDARPDTAGTSGGATIDATRTAADDAPVLGYFARMCREKGLDQIVDAYLLLKKRPIGQNLRLHIGGGCGPGDEPIVAEQKRKLAAAGCDADTKFFANVSHAEKIAFLKGVTVFSVPAPYNEAFGLYLIEAMAAGVPVVQPKHAAFPEIIAATGGGVLYEPASSKVLADAIESLLHEPARARALGTAGRKAVLESFTVEKMAASFVEALQKLR